MSKYTLKRDKRLKTRGTLMDGSFLVRNQQVFLRYLKNEEHVNLQISVHNILVVNGISSFNAEGFSRSTCQKICILYLFLKKLMREKRKFLSSLNKCFVKERTYVHSTSKLKWLWHFILNNIIRTVSTRSLSSIVFLTKDKLKPVGIGGTSRASS